MPPELGNINVEVPLFNLKPVFEEVKKSELAGRSPVPEVPVMVLPPVFVKVKTGVAGLVSKSCLAITTPFTSVKKSVIHIKLR